MNSSDDTLADLYSLKGGGGGMGSHGADGNGGGMEKGNPGTPVAGAAAAAPSAPAWLELLAPDSAQAMCNNDIYKIGLQQCRLNDSLFFYQMHQDLFTNSQHTCTKMNHPPFFFYLCL